MSRPSYLAELNPQHDTSATEEMTLLLVEDDAQIRSVLAEYLVMEAENAEIAAALLNGGARPAVVVTDINLGVGDNGLDVADHVHGVLPETPVVFITGRVDMLHKRGLRNGEYLIPKPFTLSTLTTTVRKVIPRRS
jgi:two-component system, OmpR family, response regulator